MIFYKKHCHFLVALLLITSFTSAPVTFEFRSAKLHVADAEAKKTTKKSTKKRSSKKHTSRKSKKSAPAVPQTEGPKWAAIVVDANDGSVLYEKNAESPRYPASLTKMMTLYLLFDAIENRRITLNSKLDISSKAASQPQTNISLNKGDQLSVRTAIDALIIRSANDVAMAVAENLGGSQDGFARMMNRKARELGMTKTRFYNPAGLPDDRQMTTASDMARLGIAIKRDFPEYYHLFKKSSFEYNGKTYKTHNRVVGRYPGADGIKTGYIRASGFNLVTSVTRGDMRLIGVVLGGYSSSARDQEMMNMLDRTIFAQAGKKKTTAVASAASKKTTDSETKPSVSFSEESMPSLPQLPVETSSNTLPSFVSERNWAIQVGAFPTIEQAERAAANAKKIARTELENTQLQITQVMKDGIVYNRSRLIYLNADQARYACSALVEQKKQCMVIRME